MMYNHTHARMNLCRFYTNYPLADCQLLIS